MLKACRPKFGSFCACAKIARACANANLAKNFIASILRAIRASADAEPRLPLHLSCCGPRSKQPIFSPISAGAGPWLSTRSNDPPKFSPKFHLHLDLGPFEPFCPALARPPVPPHYVADAPIFTQNLRVSPEGGRKSRPRPAPKFSRHWVRDQNWRSPRWGTRTRCKRAARHPRTRGMQNPTRPGMLCQSFIAENKKLGTSRPSSGVPVNP